MMYTLRVGAITRTHVNKGGALVICQTTLRGIRVLDLGEMV